MRPEVTRLERGADRAAMAGALVGGAVYYAGSYAAWAMIARMIFG